MSHVKAFQCPNCQNYINNLLNSCKFCSMPISDDVLTIAVGNEDFFNDAYNAASNLRISAGALATMFAFSFVPVIGIFAGWAHLFLLVTIPLGLLYWLAKYGATKVQNQTYKEARKYVWTAFFIWLAFAVLRVVLLAAFFALIGGNRVPH